MIPADGSHHVHYEKDGGTPPLSRTVVAWDNDGTPLVLGKTGLVPAWKVGTVRRVTRDASPAVGAVPGGGWMIDCEGDDGVGWTLPILAWTIHADGSATALTTDADGITSDATEGLTSYRIYHPDEKLPPATDA